MRMGIAVLALGAALAFAGACRDNSFTGNLTPVPPVHPVPPFAAGATILVAEDPIIETKDPEHVRRANENNVPRDYRLSMVQSLKLAGFKVADSAGAQHDLRAKLALAVSEETNVTGNIVRQVYRCGIMRPDGKLIAQIAWTWPRGTFVDVNEVFDFATHNLTTEIATSRPIMDYLRQSRGGGGAGSGASDTVRTPVPSAGPTTSQGTSPSATPPPGK